MKTYLQRTISRSRWVKILALSSAFVFSTNALWQAFGDPADWARDSIVGDKLALGSADAKPGRLEAPIKINVRVPVGRPTGSVSVTTLQAGKTYRIEIVGKYVWFTPNNGADAECSQYQSINDTTWQPNRLGAASPAFTGARTRQGSKLDDTKLDDAQIDDPFDVYLNGTEVNWQPVTDTGGGCNSRTHTYYSDFTPQTATRLSFHVFDPFNNNSMACVITESGGCAAEDENFVAMIYEGPKPMAEPGEVLVESVLIDPRNSKEPPEVRTVNDLQRGRAYRFVASGTYTVAAFPGYIGDAECGTVEHDDSQWTAHRWDFQGSPITDDIGDIYINGSEVDWSPRWNTNGKGCNVYDHTYHYVYESSVTGKARFLLQGDHHFLNEGLMKIDIYSIPNLGPVSDPAPVLKDLPVPTNSPKTSPGWTGSGCVVGTNGFVSIPCSVQVSARSRTGISVPLPAGTFRFQSVGSYAWHDPSKSYADAECSQWQVLPQVSDPTWLGSRFNGLAPAFGGTASDDPLDLYVAGQAVQWTPTSDSGGGCNSADHTYNYSHSQTSAKSVNFRIYDPVNVNALADGMLTVRIMTGAESALSAGDLLVSTVVLSPRSSLAGSTTVSLPKGKLHRIVASGTYRVGGYELDAECSSLSNGPWATSGFGATEDSGDVLIDGVARQWVPLQDSGGGCNSSGHEYRFNLVPRTTSPVTFRLRLDANLQYEGLIIIQVYAVGDGVKT